MRPENARNEPAQATRVLMGQVMVRLVRMLAIVRVIMFAAFVLISALTGTVPKDTLKSLTDMGLLIIAGIGLGLALVLFALGWMLGKTVKG